MSNYQTEKQLNLPVENIRVDIFSIATFLTSGFHRTRVRSEKLEAKGYSPLFGQGDQYGSH